MTFCVFLHLINYPKISNLIKKHAFKGKDDVALRIWTIKAMLWWKKFDKSWRITHKCCRRITPKKIKLITFKFPSNIQVQWPPIQRTTLQPGKSVRWRWMSARVGLAKGARCWHSKQALAGRYVLIAMTDSSRGVYVVVTNALSCSSLNSKHYLCENYLIMLVVRRGT